MCNLQKSTDYRMEPQLFCTVYITVISTCSSLKVHTCWTFRGPTVSEQTKSLHQIKPFHGLLTYLVFVILLNTTGILLQNYRYTTPVLLRYFRKLLGYYWTATEILLQNHCDTTPQPLLWYYWRINPELLCFYWRTIKTTQNDSWTTAYHWGNISLHKY